MKNILLDYMEDKEKYDYESFTEKDFFKIQTEYLTPNPTTPVPSLVLEFFDSVIPKSDHYQRYIMLISKKGCANYYYNTDDEFIAGYSKYVPLLTNTFFSPCLYDGWWESINARLCNVIFLDIDGIDDVNLITMSTSEISDWLKDTYNVPSHLLPNWCICTGHGVHLYFVVDEMDFTDTEQGKLRDYYTEMLICYFRADVTCRNRNHILRLPYGYNCKQEPLQTQLHKLNNTSDTNIKRLDYFYCDDEDVQNYKRNSYKIIAEKSAKTREHNNTQPKEKKPPKPKEVTAPDKVCHNSCVPIENVKYFDDFKRKARYWNIIKDLNNYYVRHYGNIVGCRNVFIHIMATFLKRVHMSVDEAIDFIEPYCTVDFYDEAVTTVTKVYDSEKEYHYNNDSIAMLLSFTDIDYAQSYCCYNESKRIERKREANRRAKDKQFKEARQERKEKREDICTFIKENPTTSTKDIAIIFDVSTRTIQRIKKELREEEK